MMRKESLKTNTDVLKLSVLEMDVGVGHIFQLFLQYLHKSSYLRTVKCTSVQYQILILNRTTI